MRSTAGQLSNHDFRRLRLGLMMTQAELAAALGYAHKIRISEYERETNPVPAPQHIQQALLDLVAGRRSTGKVRPWRRKATG